MTKQLHQRIAERNTSDISDIEKGSNSEIGRNSYFKDHHIE